MLAAMARGVAVPEGDLPRFPRGLRRAPDPAYEARLEALKQERNRQATRLELAPGVLCPNGTLEAIAGAQPADLDAMAAIEPVRRWQLETIGAPLLHAMQRAVVPAVTTESK
jgi:ribonuclease D